MPGLLGVSEPERLEPCAALHRGLGGSSAALRHGRRPYNNDVQRAFGHDAGIELLERAGGGVARVGEGFLAGGFALGVEFFETSFGEINFAAHFEQRRKRRA